MATPLACREVNPAFVQVNCARRRTTVRHGRVRMVASVRLWVAGASGVVASEDWTVRRAQLTRTNAQSLVTSV